MSAPLALVDGHVWVHDPGRASLLKRPGQRTPNRMAGIGTTRGWITVKRLGAMQG